MTFLLFRYLFINKVAINRSKCNTEMWKSHINNVYQNKIFPYFHALVTYTFDDIVIDWYLGTNFLDSSFNCEGCLWFFCFFLLIFFRITSNILRHSSFRRMISSISDSCLPKHSLNLDYVSFIIYFILLDPYFYKVRARFRSFCGDLYEKNPSNLLLFWELRSA